MRFWHYLLHYYRIIYGLSDSSTTTEFAGEDKLPAVRAGILFFRRVKRLYGVSRGNQLGNRGIS